ncbi:hypothetical protein KY347_06355 [Candidatus Woesearchaeota archaeon]|nr:hypothetical protein [Candidatus Woesearchaeota archaeon]
MSERKPIKLVEKPKQATNVEKKCVDANTLVAVAAGVTAIAAAPKAGENIRKIVDKGRELIKPSNKR